jgi:hypothetical protein
MPNKTKAVATIFRHLVFISVLSLTVTDKVSGAWGRKSAAAEGRPVLHSHAFRAYLVNNLSR